MGINTITGQDTLTLFDRVFTDLADDDVSALDYPTDIAGGKTGKNGNTIFSQNEQGRNCVLVMRVMRGSSDDRFLQGMLSTQKRDFAATVLCNGEFVKRLGDGQGNITRDVYTLLGGIFQKQPAGKENVSGDTEQGVAVYTIFFSEGKRSQQ